MVKVLEVMMLFIQGWYADLTQKWDLPKVAISPFPG
jgi:hypothetical protein